MATMFESQRRASAYVCRRAVQFYKDKKIQSIRADICNAPAPMYECVLWCIYMYSVSTLALDKLTSVCAEHTHTHKATNGGETVFCSSCLSHTIVSKPSLGRAYGCLCGSLKRKESDVVLVSADAHALPCRRMNSFFSFLSISCESTASHVVFIYGNVRTNREQCRTLQCVWWMVFECVGQQWVIAIARTWSV